MFGKKEQLTNIELKYIETLLLKQIELLEEQIAIMRENQYAAIPKH